ncbi:hypothetical protein [Curtobacterium sp. RRHDQ10]|uniref:hypothetical protein n=1 Tax=Curtobacterium phyllosphaerae TaxID=3413379 RepID=UPI003BEFC281
MASTQRLLITDILVTDSRDRVGRVDDELQHQKSDDKADRGVFGEGHLEHTYRDFSGDWKLHREKLRKNVDKLHQNLINMNDAFTDVQQQLTDGLKVSEEQR